MSCGRLSQSQSYAWWGEEKQGALASEDTHLLPPGRHIVPQTPHPARSGVRTVSEGLSHCATNRITVLSGAGNSLSQSYATHCLLCLSLSQVPVFMALDTHTFPLPCSQPGGCPRSQAVGGLLCQIPWVASCSVAATHTWGPILM